MATTAGETDEQDSTGTLAEQDDAADDIWDEEESPALRRARKEAEFTAGGDSTRAYLKQIGRVPLLSAAEEVDLAVRIEVGLYAVQKLQAGCEGPSGLRMGPVGPAVFRKR
ncbi:sigma-70 factor domain-containing protein [Nocardia vaccinii]|uniref:sigma-70 factor domain-containing protein n=1 Tax=Nocardia vaccinii TaxID=1822 RepID=UPI000B2A7F28